jgi:hypothetical protein
MGMSGRMATTGCCLMLALAGCRGAAAPSGTGAESVVRDYYEALVRGDWNAAYAVVHADSRAKRNATQFAQQAEGYRRQLGFEPGQVIVRSCEEHGTEATAHVVLKAGARSYKDAIAMRRDGTGWGVVLPPRFGEKR